LTSRRHGFSLTANARRNARAETDRADRWRPARDALHELLDPLLDGHERIAIVGAGNADDVPLTRLAARLLHVALIDLDGHAAQHARQREPRGLRGRIEVIEHDITAGTADAIVAQAIDRQAPDPAPAPETPLPGAPYDLVIGDLLYSQLVYPALVDAGLPESQTRAISLRHGPNLTRAAVARLHASAPRGIVVHLHDPLAWWPGHRQPITLQRILAADQRGEAQAALALAAHGRGPSAADPRRALREMHIAIDRTVLWHWPFKAGTDYLVCATVVDGR
jgi:hypothetical protein